MKYRVSSEEAAIIAGIAADSGAVVPDREAIKEAPAVRAVAPHLIERHQPAPGKAPAEWVRHAVIQVATTTLNARDNLAGTSGKAGILSGKQSMSSSLAVSR